MNLASRYLVFQKEEGAKGTPHFQGTIVFDNKMSFKQMKKLLPSVHLEPCMVLQASIEYCQKPEGRLEGPWERGDKPSQGQRVDLDRVAEMVKSGKRLRDIADECPIMMIKFHKGIEALRNICAKPRDWEMEVYVHHGLTGTGKTREAFNQCNDPYFKPAGAWWNGYDQHEDIIMDDFACDMPITELLRVCDRYPMKVPTKGGFQEFVGKRIFITSNIPYANWYEGARQEHRDALRRRITKIHHFN